ncbi:hypothetical protein KIN20_033944 [Parelaphostrongylus tenuis]|uniref:Uncharacterized protein n=1 Tax=Parelaphostrongylus tenuis TaxID=148309 RepID=A0AAD5R8X7_PARTN|nr:hypothetical protein KIN20_033944 [Parelaphostrongylus tenuis]
MIVFGDSLSDDGVEAVGESHGFMRNSNGKVWPEYVEQMLQCDLTGGVIDFFAGEKDATNVVANIEACIESITQAMSSGTLLVLSVLDLGTSPGVRAAEDSTELQQRLGELVSETNRHLARIVFDSEKGARRLYPKLRIRLLDINPLVLEAMNSLNITEPFTYHSPEIGPRSVYSYAYYDLWNPSTVVHNTLAEEIVKHLQNF